MKYIFIILILTLNIKCFAQDKNESNKRVKIEKQNEEEITSTTDSQETRYNPDLIFELSELNNLKLISGNYKFIRTIHENISPQISLKNNSQIELKKGLKVEVLYESDGNIYFQYWKFKKENEANKQYGQDTFVMSKEKFEQLTTKLYRQFKGFKVGAYTVPFRLRGIESSDFDFESSLSLQANFIAGFGRQTKQESWFDLSTGIGVTGVVLNSNNTEGENKVTEERTATALTFSLGALFKPTKFVNAGIFIGWDLLGRKDKDTNWVHNGKTWLGMGINITFDEVSTSLEPTIKKNE